jgi:pimeloyl-ACP methyl ester carboxylesterase
VHTESIWGSPVHSTPESARAKGERLYDYGMNPAGVVHQYRAISKSGSRDEALSKLQVPTLVMHGTADTLIQHDGGVHTAEVITNARFQSLDGMGHDLPRFYWAEIASAVASLVADAGFGQD